MLVDLDSTRLAKLAALVKTFPTVPHFTVLDDFQMSTVTIKCKVDSICPYHLIVFKKIALSSYLQSSLTPPVAYSMLVWTLIFR